MTIEHGLTIREVFEPTGSEKRKKGSEIQGANPVHGSPKTGTNTKINTAKDVWHCFACNSGGGVLSAVAVQEGIISCEDAESNVLRGRVLQETLKVAKEKYDADIDLNNTKTEEEIEKQQEVGEVLETVAQLSQGQLTEEDRERIKEERNLDDEDIDTYRIGKFTPEVDETLQARYSDDVLVDSGLYYKIEEDDRIGAMFTEYLPEENKEVGRVIIPYTIYGEVKYFIGRRTTEMWEYWSEQSKKQENLHDIARIYHYSDTEAESFEEARIKWVKRNCFKYKKLRTKTEYNEHVLWRDFEDRDRLVITEGIYDAISVAKAGVSVISPITTGFKKEDIPEIVNKAKSFENVYLVFDGDDAGDKGQENLAEELTREHIEPVLVDLDDDMDFDDWTNQNGYDIDKALEDGERFLDRKIEEANNVSERFQASYEDKILDLLSDWELHEVEWILGELPTRKSTLESKFKEKGEEDHESGEPSEPSEPSEPQRTTDIDSGGGLLEQLQEEKTRETIRMSGTTDKGTTISTTFMKLKGIDKAIAFAEKDGNSQLLEVHDKLKEFDKETREDMTSEQKERNDYKYVNVDDKEVLLEPKPVKIEHDMKTPDKGLLDYFKGEKSIDEDIYTKIRDYIEDHWYHYNDEWYDVLAVWSIHTYLLQDLPVTPYIFFTGVKDTGKTQAQRVLNQIAYHSVRNEQPTPASMERQVSYSHSTVHLDEMDKLSEDEATRITRTVNSGYNHGATRTLVNTNVNDIERQNKTLHTYSAKTIAANGLHMYNDTVKSRGFIIDSTPKPSDIEIDDIRRPCDDKEELLRDLRNQLFWTSLTHRESLLESIEDAKKVLNVENRQEDKLSIVYGIISHFHSEERALEVCDFLRNQSALRGKELSKTDEAFVKIVAEYTGNDGFEMAVSEIATRINDRAGIDEESNFSVSPEKAGGKLRKYGLTQEDEHKPRRSDGYYAKIPKEIILTQFKSHGFDELANRIQDSPSQNSHSTTRRGSLGSLGSLGSPPKRKYPHEEDIYDEIKHRVNDSDRDTNPGVEVEELKEDFQEVYEDEERIEKLFSDQDDKKPSNKVGIEALKNNNSDNRDLLIYEPKPGYVKPMDM